MTLNILIVDDSETARAIIGKTLRLADVPINDIYQAANGKEALEILGDQWIDLIFADINMPIMGGVEMIERLAEDGLLMTIPVIIVSTEGSITRLEELRSKGVRAVVRKPFAPEEISRVVNDIMGVKKNGE